MWTIAGVFLAGCIGAVIGALVVVAGSWREMMERWDND